MNDDKEILSDSERDTLGEICRIFAGAWQSKLAEITARGVKVGSAKVYPLSPEGFKREYKRDYVSEDLIPKIPKKIP